MIFIKSVYENNFSKSSISYEDVCEDTNNFVERLKQIHQSNLQNFLDHRVVPRGAVHVRFMMVERKKIRYRSEAPYFSARRVSTDGNTGDHSH